VRNTCEWKRGERERERERERENKLVPHNLGAYQRLVRSSAGEPGRELEGAEGPGLSGDENFTLADAARNLSVSLMAADLAGRAAARNRDGHGDSHRDGDI
jgi:hypothetical protein